MGFNPVESGSAVIFGDFFVKGIVEVGKFCGQKRDFGSRRKVFVVAKIFNRFPGGFFALAETDEKVLFFHN